MISKYAVVKEGKFTYPGGYNDLFKVSVESTDSKFIDFIDNELDKIIEEYQKSCYDWAS